MVRKEKKSVEKKVKKDKQQSKDKEKDDKKKHHHHHHHHSKEKKHEEGAETNEPVQELKAVNHPLKTPWTLYVDGLVAKERDSEKHWDSVLTHVLTFDTVEDFWRVYNNVKTPGLLDAGANYRLFRTNIEPKWEDIANQHGGCWTLTIPHNADRKPKLDRVWLRTVLACIGERLHEDNQICGAVVSVRRSQDRISVWTRLAADEHQVLLIGQRLKHELDLGDHIQLTYRAHYTQDKERGKTLYHLH